MDRATTTKLILEHKEKQIAEAIRAAERHLNALSATPDDTEFTYITGTLSINTHDPDLMLAVARCVGSKVTKVTMPKCREGFYSISGSPSIFSETVKLPETCTFKRVIRTYETLEPEGNCGSWFNDETTERNATP